MKKSILIFFFALLGVLSAQAYGFEVDGIYYNRISHTDDQVEVIFDNEKYTGSVVIPSTVTYDGTSYSVTSIGDFAFSGCSSLTSVTIPESVTSIGYAAFRGCRGLTSVTIPNSVTSIGYEAFSGCSGLTSVTIPERVTFIGESAFSGCTGLISVTWNAVACRDFEYSNYYDWYPPFRDCENITSITFGNQVEHIPAYLCYGCSGLSSVTIPESVTSIGESAFSGCTGLTSVEWNAVDCQDLEANNSLFYGCEKLTDITFGNQVEHIPAYLCYGCSGLSSVTISESVTSIGESAFSGCTGLTSVEWNAVACNDFGYNSRPFNDCENITSITFGNQVTHIPAYLCYGLESLTSVTILPESVEDIGYGAFQGCTSISNPLYNSRIFAYMPQNYSGRYTIPYGIQSIADGAFSGCGGLTSVTIPESVTSIGSSAFRDCSGLTSVTIPESVTSIGNMAFRDCTGLTSVEWNAVTCQDFESVDWYPLSQQFYNCVNITSITFGNQVERIPANVFLGLRGLTSVTIPEGVTSIGDYAFHNCRGLTSVTIPNSVASIGYEVFHGCSSIVNPLYNSKIFVYMPQNYSGEYAIPSGIQSIVPYAFSDCSGPVSVTIPNSMTAIGERAFSGCTGLTSVTIPNNLTSIGERAFSNCSGLASVTIPASVDTISESAFYGCENLLSVTSLSRTPPYCEASAFSVYGTLYVPWGCKTTYQKAQEWYKFIRIEELPSAGIATVRVQANDNAMGMVIGGGRYELGEQAMLAAVPNKDCYFEKWNDGNTSNPRILTVTGDTTLTAIFAKDESDDPVVYTVTVRANDVAMGTVVGGGEYEIGEQATLAAIPNNGYHFVMWDDENTDNPRILTVTGDTAFTAIFVQGDPTANENAEADNFRVYVQDRTICLSEDRGTVQVYNVAGQCVYNGRSTAIPVPQSGVYVVRVGTRSYKMIVW